MVTLPQTKAGVGQLVPIFRLSGLERTGWQGDLFCLVLEWVSRVNPAPDAPRLSAARTRQGSRSRLCVKGWWGGEVQFAAGRPRSLLQPSAASPLPPQPFGDRRTGGPGTWEPPSHPHSHSYTPAGTHPCAASRAPFLADKQALASLSVPLRRAATLFDPHPRLALSKQLILSRQLLRGLHHSPLDRTFMPGLPLSGRGSGRRRGSDTLTVMTRSHC